MIELNFRPANGKALQVLCLGAHSDDIEIGCGGTILRLAAEQPGCTFHWVVFSAKDDREQEARMAAELFTAGACLETPVIKQFPDGFLPFVGSEVKAVFEDLKKSVSPDVIFTQRGKDAHQDHRLLSELTWNTWRNHFILEYEIPKYDGDMGRPSVFVPLEEGTYQKKVKHLLQAFRSQGNRRWFEESTFLSLMRLRGMECNAASGYAEAFYCRKALLDLRGRL